jgi:hypothetical protein
MQGGAPERKQCTSETSDDKFEKMVRTLSHFYFYFLDWMAIDALCLYEGSCAPQ